METQELSWRERGRLWARLGIRLALVALAWLLLMRVGLPLLSLLMPFVLALCAAWLLNPLVRTLHQRLGVSRKLTSILLILLILAVAGGLIVVFVWNIAQETAALIGHHTLGLDAIVLQHVHGPTLQIAVYHVLLLIGQQQQIQVSLFICLHFSDFHGVIHPPPDDLDWAYHTIRCAPLQFSVKHDRQLSCLYDIIQKNQERRCIQ